MFGINDDDPDSDDEPEREAETDTEGKREDPLEALADPVDASGQDADGQSADDGLDVAEVDARLDELESELDSTESSLRSLQSSQEEMAGSLEEVNDSVRQLVGVYDRVIAEENPFLENSGDDTGTFSMSSASPASENGNGHQNRDGSGGQPHSTDDEPVVSFDDLVEQADDAPSRERQTPENASTEEAPTDHSAAPDPDGEPDAATAQATPDGPTGPTTAGPDTHQNESPESASDSEPLLTSVPDGYVGDVLVMRWLAALMDRSGPAGALRAVNYYETVGWISPEVRNRLVDTIGGPALDVFVDPTQPREPTADEHALSREYLCVLDRLTEV